MMTVKPFLINKVFFPVQQKITGSKFSGWFKEVMQNQWLSKVELEEIQVTKLKKLVDHAYKNVPYYTNLFNEYDLKPHDINSLSDLHKIPILTKADLQKNLNLLKARNYRAKDLFLKGTGGSTGTPTKFYIDKIHWDYMRAGQYRFYHWTGYKFGDRHALFWAAPQDLAEVVRIKDRFWNYFLNKTWISGFHFTQQDMAMATETINKKRPTLITGYANVLYTFARFVQEKSLALYTPKAVVSTAEVLFDQQKEVIQNAFGCKVFNRYGCREMCDIAQTCPESGNLLHVNSDNIILETIKNGKVTDKGEVGEIILTDLNNFASPFIRYRNDDLGMLVDKSCSCGRSLPLIEMSHGRIHNIITTPEGKYIYGMFLYYLFYELEGVLEYQIIQEDIDHLFVIIVRSENYKAQTTQWLHDRLQKACGSMMQIRFEFPESIPKLGSGKYCFIRSNIPVTF
jgi:phenylacetate-CoA ligase